MALFQIPICVLVFIGNQNKKKKRARTATISLTMINIGVLITTRNVSLANTFNQNPTPLFPKPSKQSESVLLISRVKRAYIRACIGVLTVKLIIIHNGNRERMMRKQSVLIAKDT